MRAYKLLWRRPSRLPAHSVGRPCECVDIRAAGVGQYCGVRRCSVAGWVLPCQPGPDGSVTAGQPQACRATRRQPARHMA